MSGASARARSAPQVGDAGAAAAAHLLRAAEDALRARGAFVLALSGGSLPSLVARGLPNGKLAAAGIDRWTVLLADERLVPLDHPDSNYRLVRECFPEIPPENVLPVARMDDGPDAAAEDYAEKVRTALEKSGGVFDAVYLGLGPDGHTASLFPGHELLRVTDRVVASIDDSPKAPAKRVTLTLPAINAARAVAFVCTGKGKAEVVADIFENPQSKLPGALVHPHDGKLDWFVDEPAASGLSK